MMSTPRLTLLACVLTCCLISMSGRSAQSATVVMLGNRATGIVNLLVGDQHYDVDFKVGFFGDIFSLPVSNPVPVFLNNQAGALAATTAISTFFNDISLGATIAQPIIDHDNIVDPRSFAYVPWQVNEGNFFGEPSRLFRMHISTMQTPGNWAVVNNAQIGSPFPIDDNLAVYGMYAVFNPVPEPGTVTLLAAGLSALVACAWRRRQRLPRLRH